MMRRRGDQVERRPSDLRNSIDEAPNNESALFKSLHNYSGMDQGLYNSHIEHSEKDQYFSQIKKYDDYIDFEAQLELHQLEQQNAAMFNQNPHNC